MMEVQWKTSGVQELAVVQKEPPFVQDVELQSIQLQMLLRRESGGQEGRARYL